MWLDDNGNLGMASSFKLVRKRPPGKPRGPEMLFLYSALSLAIGLLHESMRNFNHNSMNSCFKVPIERNLYGRSASGNSPQPSVKGDPLAASSVIAILFEELKSLVMRVSLQVIM